MKTTKLLYIAAFLLIAFVFALFEYQTCIFGSELIPVAQIESSPENNYLINLISVITAFGGCFLLLYFFKIRPIKAGLEHPDNRKAYHNYVSYCNFRIVLWVLLMLVNVIFYYEAPGASNPKYCILVLFIAGLFCWPNKSKSDFNR